MTAATKLVAEVVKLPIVPIFVFAVAILDALVAMSVSLDVIAAVFVEMLDALVEILDVFELILDSTLEMLPSVRVPSISASLRMVTVPEVWPKDRSPEEKSPYNKFNGFPPDAFPEDI